MTKEEDAFMAHQYEPICRYCIHDCNMQVEAIFCEKYKFKQEFCVICGEEFDYPKRFPDDFPDEWKLCCMCLDVWRNMNGLSTKFHTTIYTMILGAREKYKKQLEELFNVI